jgi:DNA-binding transcriptional LysR family regulator
MLDQIMLENTNIAVARSIWPSIGFDLVTLRMFTAAAEERSLGAAASRENLSLSSVSRRISDLEARFGVTLFDRHDRGVTLTAAGTALLAHLHNVFVLFERMALDMEAFRDGARGRVRIHAHMSASSGVFPKKLAAFLAEHPGIEVEVQEHVSQDVVHAVEVGMADVGLISGRIPTGDLHIIPWHEDKLIAVVPEKHRLACYDGVTLADLASDTFIVMQRETALRGLFREQLKMLGVPFREQFHAASNASICKMISAGLGVAILPSRAVSTHDSAMMKIVSLPLRESWSRWSVMICVRDLSNLAMASRKLVEYLIADSVFASGANQ